MSDGRTQRDVEEFLSQKQRDAYKAFCTYVVDQCKIIKKELGPNVVSRVYSRVDKQDTEVVQDALKSVPKIVAKVHKNRKKNGSFKVRQVKDIVGATVVVQYPDQIDLLREIIYEKFTGPSFEVTHEVIERPGYYATHIDIFSNRTDFRHIYCELQIKTMLHDSWSAKMHDLNYKPSGSMDSRLDRLMLSLGNTLQAIEVQSETIRNLITERWKHDSFWRNRIREKTMQQLRAWSDAAKIFDDDTNALMQEVTSSVEAQRDWRTDPTVLDDLTTRANALSLESPRSAWWVAASLAINSQRSDNIELTVTIIDEWLKLSLEEIAKDPKTVEFNEPEVWFAPMACQVLSRNEEAITFSKRIIEVFEQEAIESVQIARFNLAHVLIEREYFNPSSPNTAHAVKQEIYSLLSSCPDLKQDDPSCFYDAEGMIKVVFESDPSEVWKGIDLLQRGRDEAPEDTKEFAEATYELNARLAWRRLSEVEASIGP